MNDVQTKIAELETKGWTLAAIATEIGVTVNAVEKWKAEQRNISRSHLILLSQLLNKKPPKNHHRSAKEDRNGSK